MVRDKMQAFRQAVTELGDVSAEELSRHLQEKLGVKIEPRYIPFFRASLVDLERVDRMRQARSLPPPLEPNPGST